MPPKTMAKCSVKMDAATLVGFLEPILQALLFRFRLWRRGGRRLGERRHRQTQRDDERQRETIDA